MIAASDVIHFFNVGSSSVIVIRSLVLASIGIGFSGLALAQATVKPDGEFRSAVGLGASFTSGNTASRTLSLNADGVRATAQDKMTVYGIGLYARSAGKTTAEQLRFGGRYDYNLTTDVYSFGGLDFERNTLANLALRSMASAGVGLHAIKSDTTNWDVFGGATYTSDRFVDRTTIDGAARSSYSYPSLLLGEESTHKLTDNTTAKQRLVVYPNLRNTGEYRATWDAGLSVAMSKALNLNLGISAAYNSQPGAGVKTTDTLVTTGISMKFD